MGRNREPLTNRLFPQVHVDWGDHRCHGEQVVQATITRLRRMGEVAGTMLEARQGYSHLLH